MSSETAGQVITFYSYKGGTGRSMALANVACLLARKSHAEGNDVLMVDWDLEAPGLHRFFDGRFKRQFANADNPERAFNEQPGLVDLFRELNDLIENSEDASAEDAEEVFSALLDKVELNRFIVKTDIESLHLLKAGCFDEKYSYNVSTFNWVDFYNRAPYLIRLFAERLAEQYQYVLIDSRTGVTDTSGICTMLMPEKLVVVFTPNHQSLSGLNELIRRATDYRKQSDDLRPLVVFPLPSRVEMSELELRDRWRSDYQDLFEEVLKQVYDLAECSLNEYFKEVQLQHMSRYAYGEEVAVLVEQRSDRLSLTRSYESFTERLVNLDGPWETLSREPQKVEPEYYPSMVTVKPAETKIDFAIITAIEIERLAVCEAFQIKHFK